MHDSLLQEVCFKELKKVISKNLVLDCGGRGGGDGGGGGGGGGFGIGIGIATSVFNGFLVKN